MFRRVAVLSLLFFLAPPLSSRPALADDGPAIQQGGRVEIAATRRDRWQVIPLGRDGLLLLGTDDKGRAMSFSRYDADFKPLWSSDWEADDKLTLQESWVDDGAAWFLLHRARSAEFQLLNVNLSTGEPTPITLRAPFKPKDMMALVVQGDDAYIGALSGLRDLLRGSEGSLLHVSLGSKQVQRIDVAGAAGVDELLFDRITAGPGPEDVSVTGAKVERQHRTLYVMKLDGPKIGEALVVAPDEGEDKNVLHGSRVPLDDQKALVVGTYASGRKDYHTQGLYLAAFDGTQQSWTRYHSFTSFQHFFDYLSEGRRARLERKIDRKAEADADLDLNYLLRLHAPMVLSDRIVLVGEAYYPQYHTYTTTQTSTVNGVTTTTTTTHTVFDGYRYTHAVVAAFSTSGDLLWDASVPIGNVLSPTVRDQVAVSVQGDHIRMLYCVAGKVYVLEADGSAVHGEKAMQRLEGEGEDTEVRASWGSHSAWWYDDWFLVWGYERVKGDGERRTVFAFTKVAPAGSP